MVSDLNIVLVHGAWAEGSSWADVIQRLQEEEYDVIAPQFPMNSLDDNISRLREVLDVQNGPTLLVGHSYGGQIMTALGADAPNVVGLVYVAAFGLDEGETLEALLSKGPPSPALAHINIDEQGFAWLPQPDFLKYFAADVDSVKAKVMYAVQQPLSLSALKDMMSTPAWKTLPSWYMISKNDQVIPPDAQRLMAGRMGANTSSIESSHVSMVSHPEEVAQLIMEVAKTASK